MKLIHTLPATLLLLVHSITWADDGKGLAEVTLRTSPTTLDAAVAEEFVVEIRYDGALSTGSIVGVFLQFDADRVVFVGGEVNRTDFDDGFVTSNPTAAEPGILSFSAGSTKTITQNDLLVASLTFRGDVSGETGLVFLETPPRVSEVYDSNFDPIPTALAGTTLTVGVPPKPDAWILF
jgi:hypothetical protein